MQQQYLNALSECFKVCGIHGCDRLMHAHLCRLLELSLQPVAALDYFRRNKQDMTRGVDTIFVQDIEDYLSGRTMQ